MAYARGHAMLWGGGSFAPTPPDDFKIRMEYNDGTPAFEVPLDGTTIVTQADGDSAIGNYDVDRISKMIIGYGMTGIGESAFDGWENNEWKYNFNSEVILPISITHIDSKVFYGWYSFNQPLTIPESVTSIGYRTFHGWTSFNNQFVVPDSVTSIDDEAFYSWENFNQMFILSNNITSIGSHTFGQWYSFNQPFVIPDSVTSIDGYAFEYWTSFNQSFSIPDSVTYISYQVFNNWHTYNNYFIFNNITPPSIDSQTFRYWVDYFPARITTPNSTSSNSDWKVALAGSYNDGDIESINGVLWDDI